MTSEDNANGCGGVLSDVWDMRYLNCEPKLK